MKTHEGGICAIGPSGLPRKHTIVHIARTYSAVKSPAADMLDSDKSDLTCGPVTSLLGLYLAG
jgi:hypothetical protein